MNSQPQQLSGITPNHTVEEVVSRWPETIPVFIKYHTNCVGCDLSAFETLADAASIYRLPLAEFIKDLNAAIANPAAGSGS